ncbi:AAA family ATPase [Acetobacterium malicum]|uniref:AAA family ATPase n=1 Tax=Acetobacterium malicum TaxID=52692 RepID=UPI00041BC83E|nr:ATP-binding protein [Acetobacterium dehalogenans]
MLKKFMVTGFKNFKDTICLDFSDVRDYSFNRDCIKDGLLNKIIIYGKNGVGKSNIGLALFDLTSHLSDKNVSPGLYDYYLNADSEVDYAEFRYVFKVADDEIEYRYHKNNEQILRFEEVKLNSEIIFSYDHIKKTGDLEGLKKRIPTLNYEFLEENFSLLKYVVSNSTSEAVKPLRELVHFVNNMLWYRSLDENRYIGYKNDSKDYFNFILQEQTLQQFQELLNRAGINEQLVVIADPDGQERLYFQRKKPIPFFKAASNGTKALYTFFYWLTIATDLSFLFIDEFDAYYHFELSEMIVELLDSMTGFQTVLTSHNTNLLTNRIMRPDCYFILTPERLTSLANATRRELREGHNLEKLYVNGEFDG